MTLAPAVPGAIGDHLATAEAGRREALRGNHRRALELYRMALARARSASVPAIVLRYYSDCVIESLELSGDFDAVASYCDAALSAYETAPPTTVLARRDVAATHERRAAVLAKAGQFDDAGASADMAVAVAAELGAQAPVAATLQGWLRRGLRPTPSQVLAAQHRHRYFAVRRDTVGEPGTDHEVR